MSNNVRRGRLELEARQLAAAERQEARNARGDAGQLERLEAQGHGSCREASQMRARLEKGK